MVVPALSSREPVPRFMQSTVTPHLNRGLSSVAAMATPLSPLSMPSVSPTDQLGSELCLQLMCTSWFGCKVSVLMTCTLLASKRPIRFVHWMVLLSITNSLLSQATEQSCWLRNSISRIATDQEPCFKLHVPQTACQANAPIYV